MAQDGSDPAEAAKGTARHEAMPREVSLPVGIVLRRSPGVTRWAKWVWQASALLPGAPEADWRVLREEGGVTEYHAATLPLTLHRAEAEAYAVSLTMTPPCAFVVLREDEAGARPMDVFALTASAYEAQDYLDSGEELVEPLAMPAALVEFVAAFVEAHRKDEPFRKRRRDRARTDLTEDGVGDPRIRQAADVYRAPGALKKGSMP